MTKYIKKYNLKLTGGRYRIIYLCMNLITSYESISNRYVICCITITLDNK